MEIKAADSFFESINKIYWDNKWFMKLYYIFKRKIPNFIKNIINFRKELWHFQSWDSSFNLEVFKRTLELTREYLDKKGIEIESSRNKKIAKMDRAIELLNNFSTGNFIEQAEKELQIEVVMDHTFEEEENGLYKIKDKASEETKINNEKIFDRADELEEEQWDELWKIMKGKGRYSKEVGDYDDWYDGSDLRGWWD